MTPLSIVSRRRGSNGDVAIEDDAVHRPGGVVADVTDPGTPAELVTAAVERYGRLDIVVGNAGGPPPGAALDVDDEALTAALNANLLTSVRLVREAVPHLRANGWGRICLIASSSVRQPIPSLALSNTARAGLWAWATTAAQDLMPDGLPPSGRWIRPLRRPHRPHRRWWFSDGR